MLTIAQFLMAACVRKADVRLLIGTPAEWLERDEQRQAKFILEYYRDHGEMPPWEEVIKKFHIKDEPVKGRPEFYFRELKSRYVSAEITERVPKIISALKTDPMESLELMRETVLSMVDAAHSKKVLSWSDDATARFADYEERIGTGGVIHLSTGVPFFDKVFYGWRETDLITIGGRPGTKKSWILLFLAILLATWLESVEDTSGVLVVSNEMPESEIFERLDCIKFKLPYPDFMSGTLTRAQRATYKEGLHELKTKKGLLHLVYNVEKLDELDMLVKIYKPAMVFLDGSYLMEKGLGRKFSVWERITMITQGLKGVAKDNRTPIFNTTQLKRSGGRSEKKISLASQEDFAFGDTYSQDSDIALRNYLEPEMVFDQLIGSEVAKGRRVPEGTKFMMKVDLYDMLFEVTMGAGSVGMPVTGPGGKPEEDGPAKPVKW